ncbi:FHAD1 protein, partial [Bucco capensis]|nr:FHAD1 protein [Bucco capensis]
QEEQLRTMQEESRLQRHKLQEEVMEYKEQSKQHALTIVALEESLLEAKQQQKALEEENAALLAKIEGPWLEVPPAPEPHSCVSYERWTILFSRRFKEELEVAQSMLLSKEAIITALSRELLETRARMSDLKGELNEEQKVELEQNLRQLKTQEQELKLLGEKLSQMASLVEQKEQALQTAAEELRYMPPGHDNLAAINQFSDLREFSLACCSLGCSFQEVMLDLAKLGAKCRGFRHEQTIQRQKEGLAELRLRAKLLEERQPSVATRKGSDLLMFLPKDLPEKIVQKTGLEKEPAIQLKGSKVTRHIPSRGLPRNTSVAASMEMAEGTELGEKMYLDVIGALGRLLKMKELSGMQPLKHLPQEERETAAVHRRKALELLYEKIRNLKSGLERKEEMLQGYKASVEQLRLNEASLQRCQEEMSKLEDEAFREAEEKALLKEALQRTQLQLKQEKRLLRAAKVHKV